MQMSFGVSYVHVLLTMQGHVINIIDYLRSFYSSLEGAMKLKLCHYAPLEMYFSGLLLKAKFLVFGRKPWTIVRRFDRNRAHSLSTFYSSLEGATKLKFALFCSP